MLAQEFGLWKLLLGEMRQFPMWAAGPDLVPHNSGQKTQETSNPQRLGSGNSQHRQKKGLDKWVLVMWAAGLEPFCGLFSEQLSHFINILKTPEIILFLATKRRHKILTSGASHGRDEVYLESWVSFRNKTPVDIQNPNPYTVQGPQSTQCTHKPTFQDSPVVSIKPDVNTASLWITIAECGKLEITLCGVLLNLSTGCSWPRKRHCIFFKKQMTLKRTTIVNFPELENRRREFQNLYFPGFRGKKNY